MKKLNLLILITISFIMISHKSNAQGDAAVLGPLIAQTNILLGAIETSSVTMQSSIANLQAIQNQEYTTNQINDDIMWKVSDIVKKSKEAIEIYEKEKRIFNKLQNINSMSSSIGGNSYNEINNVVRKSLDTTSSLISMSNTILSDKSTRQTDGERKEFLNNILSNLNAIEMMINKLNRSISSYNKALTRSKENEQKYQEALNSSKTAKDRLKSKN